MTETTPDMARRLLVAETKIEMLNSELHGLMAITAALLVRVSDDPHRLLEALRSDRSATDDELAAIDAVGALVDYARERTGQH